MFHVKRCKEEGHFDYKFDSKVKVAEVASEVENFANHLKKKSNLNTFEALTSGN